MMPFASVAEISLRSAANCRSWLVTKTLRATVQNSFFGERDDVSMPLHLQGFSGAKKPSFCIEPIGELLLLVDSGSTRTLTERGFVEAAQLARVQRLHLIAQQIQGRQADAQVLVHRSLIEGVGGAGQLDLAVQRLVRYAQQGAVGYAQTITLGGDGAAFHVHRHGAGQVDQRALL